MTCGREFDQRAGTPSMQLHLTPLDTRQAREITVVGAGIVGLFCAVSLQRAGRDVLSPRPLADSVERIALFHRLGLRVVQMTYNYAELCGDGCLEPRNAGLSRLGFTFVEEMNRVGIAIDLSHVGEKTTLDVTRASRVPVLLTHANAKAIHDRPRNKSDEVMKAVAATGGIVGLSIHGFMNWANDPSTPPSLAGFVEQVRYAVNLVGIDHVGFGTDFASVRDAAATAAILDMSFTKFPGATADYVRAFGNTLEKRYPDEINHPRFMHRKTDALLRGGFTESEVEKIMGENMLRAFVDIWG